MKSKSINIWRITMLLVASWTFSILFIMAYQVDHIKGSTVQNGLIQAQIAFAKDLVYRRWGAMLGGVYAEVSDKIQPNPYLEVKERDIKTPSGQQLTLINPAYMTRLVHELEKKEKGVVGHLTSLNPINPENVPDEWERTTLRSFSGKEDAYFSIEEMNGAEYLRYMKPFIVSKSCLKCHSHQGYVLGDIRGGISVSVPMDPLRVVEWSSIKNSLLVHGIIWLIGLVGLWWWGRRAVGQLMVQQRIEKEKEKLRIKLLHAHKLEAVGQLAAGIAHEINTPAQFVTTNLDFMAQAERDISAFIVRVEKIVKNGPQEIIDEIRNARQEADWDYLSEELPQAISQSRDGIKRVTSIVLAMKEFSHPTSKEMEPQNLNKIINTTITVARNEWSYVADVKLNLDPQLPVIPMLADEMGQVVLNMLVNAAQAIGEKLGDNPAGDKGTISIMTRKVDDMVELHIKDTGTGIPEEVRPRVFDPFYTTKEVGKGIGQGLAICHDVITEKHSGTIDFETETDKGTEFIIRIPLIGGELP